MFLVFLCEFVFLITSANVHPKVSEGHLKSSGKSWTPNLVQDETSLLNESAISKLFNLYKTHGKQTAWRQREAGNGCMVHNSGTKICFCSRFSRLFRLVSSLLVGKATPLRLTYRGVKKFNLHFKKIKT